MITVSYKPVEGGLELIKQKGTFTIEASLPFLGTYVPLRALNLLETCCISTSHCPYVENHMPNGNYSYTYGN